MHVSGYACKTCLKELGILLKCKEPCMESLQSVTFLQMLVFHKFFLKISDILYFKNNNFLAKTKRCLLCWFLWIQTRILRLKLPDDWQISKKQNHIFQKSKSYEISSTATGIYLGENLEFNIHLFSWCIP